MKEVKIKVIHEGKCEFCTVKMKGEQLYLDMPISLSRKLVEQIRPDLTVEEE